MWPQKWLHATAAKPLRKIDRSGVLRERVPCWHRPKTLIVGVPTETTFSTGHSLVFLHSHITWRQKRNRCVVWRRQTSSLGQSQWEVDGKRMTCRWDTGLSHTKERKNKPVFYSWVYVQQKVASVKKMSDTQNTNLLQLQHVTCVIKCAFTMTCKGTGVVGWTQ